SPSSRQPAAPARPTSWPACAAAPSRRPDRPGSRPGRAHGRAHGRGRSRVGRPSAGLRYGPAGPTGPRARPHHPERPVIPTPAPSTTRPGRSGEHGFTWSEFVLVVLFVVGLLTVAVLSVNGLRDDTRVTNCQNAKRALMTAAARYQ